MVKLFEGFEILCKYTDYDYILEKSKDIIQGRIIFKLIHPLH